MSKYASWGRIDPGAEGLWEPENWRLVLAIIKKHEGSDPADESNPVYTELRDKVKRKNKQPYSWLDDQGRSLFRDYRKPWTVPDLITLEDSAFRVTDLGNQFLNGEIPGAQVLVRLFQNYVDGKTKDKPFPILCRAMIELQRPLSGAELEYISANYRPGDNIHETIALNPKSGSDLPSRGFKHFLTLLCYAGVLLFDEDTRNYVVWNRVLAEQIAVVVKTEKQPVRMAQNRIFYGPPGTGKSYLADQVAKSCIPHRALFHPEYTHAQFVGMLRPVVGYQLSDKKEIFLHDGNSTDRQPFTYFSFVPGVFSRGLVDAYNALAEERHVALIIDEINRGDCAAIFGDIFQLLDRDEAGFSQYGISISEEMRSYFTEATGGKWDVKKDGLLYLPANFSIIATMNTSDQSLYPMDSAFKRRWEWSYVPIVFSEAHAGWTLTDCSGSWDWPGLVALINECIVADRQEDKQIGPWFVRAGGDGQVPEDVFANKVLFYLWHDIWSEEIGGAGCPFDLPSGAESFGELQRIFRKKGLKGVFKRELWERLQEPSEEGSAGSTGPGE